jgi:aminoglycoside phosphotransferase (APT) family kinase protein
MSGVAPRPAAEAHVDAALVRALLADQHPDLACLALSEIGEGWDNRLFRLGHELVVRLPRREASAALIEQEQRWLPELAPRLPLPIPVPLRIGRPGRGFSWPWSVTPWFAGTSALRGAHDEVAVAFAVSGFLQALHTPAAPAAPRNPWRGIPLAERTATLMEQLPLVAGLVDRTAVLEAWQQALAAPPWPGHPVWIHGDLHPDNILIADGRPTAVIDFGDLASGDPATDWAALWMLLPDDVRAATIAAIQARVGLDDDTLRRAHGWALTLGIAYLGHSRDDEVMAGLGKRTIEAAIAG